MRDLGDSLGVPIHVFGPETHITAIVPMALGLAPIEVLQVEEFYFLYILDICVGTDLGRRFTTSRTIVASTNIA
jgi:hypothetical protein